MTATPFYLLECILFLFCSFVNQLFFRRLILTNYLYLFIFLKRSFKVDKNCLYFEMVFTPSVFGQLINETPVSGALSEAR